ncbi:MAG TPA: hypothetical protein VMT51_16225 [Dongiaceae bacterium]|nr:hypothetical protein [Dongiaceae bacterium]
MRRQAGSDVKRGEGVAGAEKPSQREALRDIMLSAAECAVWLTLEDLARMTEYPPASISAQLRHLRKERYGGYRLAKRCRPQAALPGVLAERAARVWEYKLDAGHGLARGGKMARPPVNGTPRGDCDASGDVVGQSAGESAENQTGAQYPAELERTARVAEARCGR